MIIIISSLVVLAILFLAYAWVVAVDSRKRWPGVPWYDRLARILTFYRD